MCHISRSTWTHISNKKGWLWLLTLIKCVDEVRLVGIFKALLQCIKHHAAQFLNVMLLPCLTAVPPKAACQLSGLHSTLGGGLAMRNNLVWGSKAWNGLWVMKEEWGKGQLTWNKWNHGNKSLNTMKIPHSCFLSTLSFSLILSSYSTTCYCHCHHFERYIASCSYGSASHFKEAWQAAHLPYFLVYNAHPNYEEKFLTIICK